MLNSWTADEHWLRFTTEKLGGVRTGAGGQPQSESIDDLLRFDHGKARDRNVDDQISTHRVLDVLGADQRIGSDLGEVETGHPTRTLGVRVRNGHLDGPVILGESTLVDARGGSRKRIRHGIDRDGLGIGKHWTVLSAGPVVKTGAVECLEG